MIYETVILNKERNVKVSCLCYEQSLEFKNIAKRPFIIILPGGGYQFCSKRESDPVAFKYLETGYNVFILEYSVKDKAKWPNPLTDYDTLIDFLKLNQERFNLDFDRFAVIGFSAGGHLAISTGLYGKVKPKALILGYPVVEEKVAVILEDTIPDILPDITPSFPPTFLFQAITDDIVPVSNSITLISALARADVIFESHLYPFGPHGFSTGERQVLALGANTSSRVANWVTDSLSFLKELFGDFALKAFTERRMPLFIKADARKLYSLDTSLEFLLSDEKSKSIVEKYILSVIQKDVIAFSLPFGVAAQEFAKCSFDRFLNFIQFRTPRALKAFNQEIDYNSLEKELLALNQESNPYFKEYLNAKA